jgi:ABC-type sugar transport system ATPase subunit
LSPHRKFTLVKPGKSTILGLVQGFYQPNRGQILIDDVPMGVIDVNLLRRTISVVGQDPKLFNISIRDNILYGLGMQDQSVSSCPEPSIILEALCVRRYSHSRWGFSNLKAMYLMQQQKKTMRERQERSFPVEGLHFGSKRNSCSSK